MPGLTPRHRLAFDWRAAIFEAAVLALGLVMALPLAVILGAL